MTDVLAADPTPPAPSRVERLVQALPGMKGAKDRQKIATAVRGSVWTITGFGMGQVLRFVSTLVLARLLTTPEAFGLVALVNVFVLGLEMFAELGVKTSVVQSKRGDEPAFLGTAFTIQAVRGIILGAVAIGLAYPFAMFYDTPALTALTMVGGLNLVVRGLVSPVILSMTRHVRLAPITMLTIGSEVVGLAVAVTWALNDPSAWAIVAGTLSASLTFTGVSHLLKRETPWFRWDRAMAREIITFGGWIFVATATAFLAAQAERLVLGKFVSMADLGCFSIALMIASVPTRGFMQVVGQVFFPMISATYRVDPGRAASQYSRCKWLFLWISIALCAFLVLTGPLLVSFLFPPEFEAAGWMLQLLGIRAAMEIVGAPTASMLLAIGAPRVSAAGNSVRLVVLAIGLGLAFTSAGIREAVWVLTLAPLSTWLVSCHGLIRRQPALWKAELGTMGGFIVSVAAILGVSAAIP